MSSEIENSNGYNNLDAFAIIEYHNNTVTEKVWNSRDGKVPHMIPNRNAQQIINEGFDIDKDVLIRSEGSEVAEDYLPNCGDRIFVDVTPELAEDEARKAVDDSWETLELTGAFETKEDAIKHIKANIMEQSDIPMLYTVTAEWRDARLEKLRENGGIPQYPMGSSYVVIGRQVARRLGNISLEVIHAWDGLDEEFVRAVDDFASEMKVKLKKKQDEGYQGGLEPENKGHVLKLLLEHELRYSTEGSEQEVDIANLAMMLWSMRQKDKELVSRMKEANQSENLINMVEGIQANRDSEAIDQVIEELGEYPDEAIFLHEEEMDDA